MPKLIKQNYLDTVFTDKKQFHWSSKVYAEDITIIDGPATATEIADYINHRNAQVNGKAVGWRR